MDLKPYVKKLFVIMFFISCFTCYSRADYNLSLFAFSYIMWDMPKPSQKFRLTLLFLFSLFFDLVWLIFWGSFWDSAIFDHNWSKGVHNFVIVLSVFNFLFKILTVGIILITEPDIKIQILDPKGLLNTFKEFIGLGQKEGEE